MEIKFFLSKTYIVGVLTYLSSPIEWQTFCQNSLTCYYFLRKKTEFPFLVFPYFRVMPEQFTFAFPSRDVRFWKIESISLHFHNRDGNVKFFAAERRREHLNAKCSIWLQLSDPSLCLVIDFSIKTNGALLFADGTIILFWVQLCWLFLITRWHYLPDIEFFVCK